MIKTIRTFPSPSLRLTQDRRPAPPRDPLPLGMLSPASAIAPSDDPRIAPEIIVVSEPPPARVLP
ncbi:MAG: hypothetical protein JNM30_15765 [Rhodospirillales bacterium]|nr:hypothetical protein [Rhodospirillales bacterium]